MVQNATEIPNETALRLCQEIREENRGKWYTLNGLRCWWCSTFSSSPEKRCFASRPDFRGCGQVNARYDTLPKTGFVLVTETAAEAPAETDTETWPGDAAESPPVICLPPAGFSAMQRRVVCAGCGRQFRIAANQKEREYCPTCDYRRLRGQLIEQIGDDGEDDDE